MAARTGLVITKWLQDNIYAFAYLALTFFFLLQVAISQVGKQIRKSKAKTMKNDSDGFALT